MREPEMTANKEHKVPRLGARVIDPDGRPSLVAGVSLELGKSPECLLVSWDGGESQGWFPCNDIKARPDDWLFVATAEPVAMKPLTIEQITEGIELIEIAIRENRHRSSSHWWAVYRADKAQPWCVECADRWLRFDTAELAAAAMKGELIPEGAEVGLKDETRSTTPPLTFVWTHNVEHDWYQVDFNRRMPRGEDCLPTWSKDLLKTVDGISGILTQGEFHLCLYFGKAFPANKVKADVERELRRLIEEHEAGT